MLGSCIVMEVTHVKCCYSVIQGIARVTLQNLEGLKSWFMFWAEATAEWPEPGYLDSMPVSLVILVRLLLWVRKKNLTMS